LENVSINSRREKGISFRSSRQQKNKKTELQKWAIYFYQQKSVDPETGKQVPIIEKPEIGLLIKEATYTFIYLAGQNEVKNGE
jgi:hypothetical protein